VGAGFTVPTQIAFVPMLLSLPPYSRAAADRLALGLGLAPGCLGGRLPASSTGRGTGEQLVRDRAGGGPGDERPRRARVPPFWALACCLLRSFIGDRGRTPCASSLQHRVELIESCCAKSAGCSRWTSRSFPLGLALTLATVVRPWAVLLAVPLFGLLSVFSR
jgi:hypothetical protein